MCVPACIFRARRTRQSRAWWSWRDDILLPEWIPDYHAAAAGICLNGGDIHQKLLNSPQSQDTASNVSVAVVSVFGGVISSLDAQRNMARHSLGSRVLLQLREPPSW